MSTTERERRLRRALAVAGGAAVALWLCIAAWPLSLARVGSPTMSPSYAVGDWIATWTGPRPAYRPERGDVITFPAPPSTGEREGEGFIKRVVALPGERVEVVDGGVRIDGEPIDEPWANLEAGPGPEAGPLTVPEGHVYVLGDLRGLSYDSRTWGPLALARVTGPVIDQRGQR